MRKAQLEVLVDRQSNDCERRAGTKHNARSLKICLYKPGIFFGLGFRMFVEQHNQLNRCWLRVQRSHIGGRLLVVVQLKLYIRSRLPPPYSKRDSRVVLLGFHHSCSCLTGGDYSILIVPHRLNLPYSVSSLLFLLCI